MASVAHRPGYRQMTVEEFIGLPIEGRAELEDGVFYMMAGGSPFHAAIGANILAALGTKLRGSGCRPMSSDMVIVTGSATIRMPDATVYCNVHMVNLRDQTRLRDDPKVIFEVLSPSTRKLDLEVKLPEYRTLPGVDAIVFVDPDVRRVRLVERTGPEAWADAWLDEGTSVPLRTIEISLSHDDIFALE